MRRIGLGLAAAAVLMAQAGLARAQAAQPASGDEADVRCVAALSYIVSTTTDEKTKSGLAAGVFYFIGKFDGRKSDRDLEAAIRAQLPALAQAGLMQSELVRCGGELQKRGQDAITIGAHLQANPGG